MTFQKVAFGGYYLQHVMLFHYNYLKNIVILNLTSLFPCQFYANHPATFFRTVYKFMRS